MTGKLSIWVVKFHSHGVFQAVVVVSSNVRLSSTDELLVIV